MNENPVKFNNLFTPPEKKFTQVSFYFFFNPDTKTHKLRHTYTHKHSDTCKKLDRQMNMETSTYKKKNRRRETQTCLNRPG